MKLVSKVGVSILSLWMLAIPIMACAQPAAEMTAAERECCKRMARDCGMSGMPQSHPCCQTTPAPDHLAVIKSSSDIGSRHLGLVVAHALPLTPTVVVMSDFGSLPLALDIHSPPVSISILRI